MLEHIVIPEPADRFGRVLNLVYHAALRATSPRAACDTLVSTVGQQFGAKRAYIYELPPDASEFVCTVEWCAEGVEPMTDVTHGVTAQMASRWFNDGEDASILAVKDSLQLVAINAKYASLFGQRDMSSQILGKLMRGNSPLGVLGFDDPNPEQFDEICRLMYPICAFATATINARNLLGRMRTAGVVDKLTGAGTRLGFYEMAERLPRMMPIGVAYLDIVGLQAINDVRGHDAGDQMLIAVRQILVGEFQDQQVFRMAGDEFLVAALGIDREQFFDTMQRIRERLSDLSCYVAVGTIWRPQLGSDYDSLVRRAWISCDGDKDEWEQRGGKRLRPSGNLDAFFHDSSQSETDALGEGLDLPLYRNDEFFHRANVWINHVEARRVGMIAFDINYFKLYNSIYGRERGDLMLETYAKSLYDFAIEHRGVAGYLGGDNFAFAFPVRDEVDEQTLFQIIEKELLSRDVAEGFAPAAGVAITSDLGLGVTILYDRALVALQKVKGSYTQHVNFYDEGRYERDRANQLLLIDAQNGVERGEFTFYLQPKVNIQNDKVVSAEALVRWIHNGKIVPPVKFVDLMERSGYIFALDRCVWESVCAWQRSLINRGVTPVPVSVNVSRIDFYFTDLAEHFLKLVRKYDLPPRLLGIEVTESAYSRDTETITDVIRRMQAAGFTVLMDDFGTGYSSLNMLRSVTVDALKMDKGFIDNAALGEGSDSIIANVIKMAHTMDLPVISEGVETEEQRDCLRAMGCDYVQGYFYYKPMPMEEFEGILRRATMVEHEHADDVIL